jgi:hypothetical protein
VWQCGERAAGQVANDLATTVRERVKQAERDTQSARMVA